MSIYGGGMANRSGVFQHGALAQVRKLSQNYDVCDNRDSIILEIIKWKKSNVESTLVPFCKEFL